tara:strand:- start:765 stop:977 length:213 start_codon:yes stop_codon:yes gene_type:complete
MRARHKLNRVVVSGIELERLEIEQSTNEPYIGIVTWLIADAMSSPGFKSKDGLLEFLDYRAREILKFVGR